jgi:hypothetical protein
LVVKKIERPLESKLRTHPAFGIWVSAYPDDVDVYRLVTVAPSSTPCDGMSRPVTVAPVKSQVDTATTPPVAVAENAGNVTAVAPVALNVEPAPISRLPPILTYVETSFVEITFVYTSVVR